MRESGSAGLGGEHVELVLRETDRTVTEICLDVGFTSLGTFSRTFRSIVGEPPSAYRARAGATVAPTCITMAWMRPSSFGEAPVPDGASSAGRDPRAGADVSSAAG